jgi:hypothetical protein
MGLGERVKYSLISGGGLATLIGANLFRKYNPKCINILTDSLPNYSWPIFSAGALLTGLSFVDDRISKQMIKYLCTATTSAFIFSEFIQANTVGTFDFKDIAAYSLGGLTTLLLSYKLNPKPSDEIIDFNAAV